MKINFLISGIFKSGGVQIIFEYCNRLTEKGHDVVLYYPMIPYEYYSGKVDFVLKPYAFRQTLMRFLERKKTEQIPYKTLFKIKQVPWLGNSFIRDADVSIATVWQSAYSLSRLDEIKGRKFYFVQDYEIWNSDKEKVDRSYTLDMKKITTTNFLHDLMKEKFNTDSVAIPFGFDIEFFSNNNKNYNAEIKKICFVDYKLEKKNVGLCIDTCIAIKNEYDNVSFVSFGLENFHSLPEFIRFVKDPNREKLREIYHSTDIFLFSSKIEGFGMPPAEAMASKCAVITTNVGFIQEYAENNVSALVVDMDDSTEMISSVKKLLENDELRKKISEGGFELITKQFSWEKAADDFERVISEK